MFLLQQINNQCQPSFHNSSESEKWLKAFQVPDRFSRATTELMKQEIIIDKVRREIVHSIALQMYQHTTYPTSEEYTTVCRRLVEKYPFLKDTVGNGIVCCTANTA